MTGFQTISGKDYYFDNNGIMQTGFFEAGYSYFNDVDDYYNVTGQFYAGDDGVLLTGFHDINDNRYYFYSESKKSYHKHMIAIGRFEVGGFYYQGDSKNHGALLIGKHDKYYYREKDEDGLPKYSQKTNYWIYEDGQKKYYIDSQGRLAAGAYDIDGKAYLFNWFSNELNRGFYTYDDYAWYSYEDGTLAVGLTYYNGRYINCSLEWPYNITDNPKAYKDGKWYYILPDGSLGEGFHNNVYYWPATSKEQTPYSAATGLFKVDGKLYGAYSDGTIYSGKLDEEFKNRTIYGYSDSETPGEVFPYGTFTYYSQPTSSNNAEPSLVTGWFKIDGQTFYAGPDYKVRRGFQWIDGKRYYFYSSEDEPYLFTNWFSLNGFKYYAGKDGVLRENFQTIDEKKYYFWPDTKDGHYRYTMAKNWFKVNGFSYYAGSDGVLRKGFQTIGNKKYYFWPDTKDGHYRYTMANGWFSLNGFKYWADSSGVVATGFKTINGKGYYFWPDTKDGHYRHTMVKGWFSVNGFKYWADSNGVVATGFKTINGKGYYFWPKTANGHYAKTMAKGWFSSNGFKYWADKNGVLATGWKTINCKKYYFWPKTANGHYAKTMATGTVKIDNKKYTFSKDGVLKK